MSEQGMRGRVTKALRVLDAIAVENPAHIGTPDVNYVGGWIELKWLRRWPVNEDTVVAFPHFTTQQRIFHIRRRQAGGACWVMVQCRREWLLFAGEDAALHLGKCTKQQMISLAHKVWPNGLVQKELVECVSNPMKSYSFTGDDAAKLRKTLRTG